MLWHIRIYTLGLGIRNSMFDLIIFDCDGTLVDSEYLNNLAIVQLLKERGLGQYTVEYSMNHFVGVRLNLILSEISAETGHVFPDDFTEQCTARVKNLAEEHLKTLDGAKDLVSQAHERMKICVGSNGERSNVVHSIKLAELYDYFGEDHIFTAIEVEEPKPAPDLFHYACKKMGTPESLSLVIEDSIVGVTAGAASGIETWGFTGAHPNTELHTKALKKAGATKVFDSLIHIREALFG